MMKQQKFLTGFLALVLVIASLHPGFGQTRAQESESYVPSGILVTELGNDVPPGRLNVRFPRRDPVQVGEEIRAILQKPDSTSDRPVLAQTVPDITPEIQTLATGLENDPLAIYDYVHNYVDYIPSWGLLKNPRETLLAGAGNAFDQAALLSALLEAAGFQTQYAWGNVRMPKTDAMNWVGATDPAVVGNIFASGGIPTADEGSTLLMTHIWVEVYDAGDWHQLDPSFKTYMEQAGQDLSPLLGYDLSTFTSDAEDGATITDDYVQHLNQMDIRDDLATYALDLVNYLRDHDTFIYPEELIGGRQIVPIESNGYPSSLPYDVVATLDQEDDIPDSFAYELTIQLPGIDYTVNVDDIAGERITIFYECATPDDCQRLEDGGGVYNVEPAYLVNMVPKLRIGGTVVDTGNSVPLGSWGHRLDVILTTPIDSWVPSFSQFLVAGEWYALPMRLQTVSNQTLARQVDLLNEAMSQGLDPTDEGVLGQILYLLGLSYFNEVDLGDRIDSRLAKIVHIPHFSMMIASRNLIAQPWWNPVALDPASHTVDVRLDVHSALSAENPANADRERAWFLSSGMRGSAVEHAIIEQLQPVPAISTVQILNSAIQEGQPIYYITPDNKDYVIPLLGHSYGVTMSVTLDVTGVPPRHVVISKDPVTYGEWHGSGWITLDPDSGSAGYLISGSLLPTVAQAPLIVRGGGGAYRQPDPDADSVLVVLGTKVARYSSTRSESVKHTDQIVRDPIDIATGTFMYHHQDLAPLGGLGFSLSFDRFYASSQHSLTSTLGYGWRHTYDTHFYTSTDWVRGFGVRTALEAAPALAAAQVGSDLFDATDIPHQRFATDVTVAHWLMTQITGNAATLIEPDGTVAAHVRLSDDDYQPPAGGDNLDTVTIAGDGSAILAWENGRRMHFDADGHPTALEDANGNRTTLSYDSQTRLSQVSDAVGRNLTFTYDAQGCLSQVSDPSGRDLVYGYDSQGNLQTYTDPRDGVTTYSYNSDHRMIGITDTLGIPYVTNQYDALGRVMTQGNGRGGQTGLLYGGDHTVVTDPMGYRTTYFYDERNRLFDVEEPLGNRTLIAYDAADHEIGRTNSLSQATSFAYDAWGHLTTITDALGSTITWGYDGGNPITYTDQLNKHWQYTYDGQNNLTAVIDPLGSAITYTHTSQGQLEQVRDSTGGSLTHEYDGYGNLTSITNALDETSRWQYDFIGRPISFTNGTGHTTQFRYDAADNLIQVTDPLGHQTSYTYDASGNLIGFTDARGYTTTFDHDAQFNLTSVNDAMGGVTTYEYDANDSLARVTDANGHVTTYQRDQVGRVISITDPISHSIALSYDAANRLICLIRADGSSIDYQRDALGRLTGVEYPTGPDLTFGYNAAGDLINAAYGDQWNASYEYDDVGRLSTIEDEGRSLTLAYAYDPAGRRTSLRVSRGVTIPYDLAYSYDAAGRLSTLTDQVGSPPSTIGFSSDAAGRMVQITGPGGARADYIYDPAGRLTTVSHRDERGDNVATYDYAYDANGNPTLITETIPVGSLITSYAYDALDRLTAEIYPRYTIEYTYDPVGNLIQRADPLGITNFVYDNADQLQSRGSESFDYDMHGNLTTWRNARGTYTYTYDHRDLLTDLTLPDGTALAFTYDAFGRRLTALGPVGARDFLHDGLDIVLEGNSELSQIESRYLYGDGLLVARHTDQLGFIAYHGDALENVRYLLDDRGRPFDAYRSDAFGRPARPAGIDPNPFHFIGQRSVYQHDIPAWPPLLMGYRYYDPAGGRFLTQDPLPGDLLRPHSLNDYNYALSNPVRYSDPAGLRGPSPKVPRAATPLAAAQSSPASLPGPWAAPPKPEPSPPPPRPLPPEPMPSPQGPVQPTGKFPTRTLIRRFKGSRPQRNKSLEDLVWLARLLARGIRPSTNSLTWLFGFDLPMVQKGGSAFVYGPVRSTSLLRSSEAIDDADWAYENQRPLTYQKAGQVYWQPIVSDGSTYALTCSADDRMLAGAFHAGLSRSTDAGHVTWDHVYAASVGEILATDPDIYRAGTWRNGVLESNDGGISWAPINDGLTANDVYALAADPTTLDRLFAGTEMGLFVRDDGGTSWNRPAGSLPGRVVSELTFDGGALLAVTDLGLYRRDDGGASWVAPTVDLPSVPINVVLAGSPAGTVYAGTSLGLYRSTDAGDTWSSYGTGLGERDIHALAIDPSDASHMVAGTTGGLFVSTDGGATWAPDTHVGLDGLASQVGALAFCPNGGEANLYLGTGGGVYALRTLGAPVSVTVAGPTTGVVQTWYTFTASVNPLTTTRPLTYTWKATDQNLVINADVNSLANTVPFTWTVPGVKTVTVTVGNQAGAVSVTHLITIALPPQGPTGVSIDGPTDGLVNISYTFTARVSPATTTLPLTYTWEATDKDTVTHVDVDSLTGTVPFTWTLPGTKTVTVTVGNNFGTASATHTLEIDLFKSLLPLILHHQASTPNLVDH